MHTDALNTHYYIVRHKETNSCLKGYGTGWSSPPKLYKTYGIAQAQINAMPPARQEFYTVDAVVINQVELVN